MDRRKSAVVRIIAWSVVAVALIILLVLGLNRSFFGSLFGELSIGIHSGYYYPHSDKYKAGGGEIHADEVRELDINWIDGSVTIEPYEGDTIKLSEKDSGSIPKDDRLHYFNNNGRLLVQYRKADKKMLTLSGNIKEKNKELLVQIPVEDVPEFKLVSVDAVSSQTSLEGIIADEIRLDSTSGDHQLLKCRADKLSMDSTSGMLEGSSLAVKKDLNVATVSGAAKVEGSFGGVEFDAVSGELFLDSSVCPDNITTSTTSGSVTLNLPENEGFKYQEDTVSGSVDCEFPITGKEDEGTYKNGKARFNFDSVSGDITIKKK